MKFLILAAGRPTDFFSDELPTCLHQFDNENTFLDKLTDNANSAGIANIYLVGGFKLESIMVKYPDLKYFYSDKWEYSKSLSSLYSAKSVFDDEIIVSFSDVVYKKNLLEKLASNKHDVSIAIDTKWEKRYDDRSKRNIHQSDKIFQNLKDNSFRVGKGEKNSDEKILGESIGVFHFSSKVAHELSELIENLYKRDLMSINDLINHLIQNYTYEFVDTVGDWAELDYPEDLHQFKFGTKAETLDKLEGSFKHSKILPQFSFTVKDYKSRKSKIINDIKNAFQTDLIIVRSSALNEDTENNSMAGNYESILNVDINSPQQIEKSINHVIESYLKDSQTQNLENQILVQPQLTSVNISGVVFTKDIETSAPYYTINYDLSGSTETITSGEYSSKEKTFIFYKHSKELPLNKMLNSVIKGIKEIENVLNKESLDIEFAMSKGILYILQIRPIASQKKELKVFNQDISISLDGISSFLNKKFGPEYKLVGKTTMFGVMPDWNPAEIIGINPKPLSFDLYKELITDEIWPLSRKLIGYRDTLFHEGLYSIAGKPYVDVRLSFNTFTPADISEELAQKLIDFYTQKLSENKHLHDKIEFDVCFTCFDFNLENRFNELKSYGFDESDIVELNTSLKKLTSKIINQDVIKIEDELNKTLQLTNELNTIISSSLSLEDKIKKLIYKCKTLGTLPFAILARLGFVGSILFKSLKKIEVISDTDYDNFFLSINTVAKEYINHLNSLNSGEISKKTFLKLYGHLRPGTYDINSKNYLESFEDIFRSNNLLNEDTATKFEINDDLKQKIHNCIQENELNFDAKTLIEFTIKATEARERSKFEFSKTLSKILDLILEFAEKHNINRSDAAYLNLDKIIKKSSGSDMVKFKDELLRVIKKNKELHKITSAIKLPPIIDSKEDIFYFHKLDAEPNFITQKQIKSEATSLKSSNENLSNKIILIENADPGFDWIFGHNISGLITKYGGAASHMAIRCAEFGLPAAIGCGDKLFSKLEDSKYLLLDCLNKQVKKI